MPLYVSKDCFPTPNQCHNCARKETKVFKKESDPKKEFKRCGNCHIMTYCDKDCQKEHWMRVHKKHCRFLSGKVLVGGSKHNAATCARCVEEREASPTQLRSEYSPKSVCNIEEITFTMKVALNGAFGFHEEGKKCNCSLQCAFDLPFPLGEVSGQYLEAASTGLDAILAHILKILTAMGVKAKKEDHKNILFQLWGNIICERFKLWCTILVTGKPIIQINEDLFDQVDNLETIYRSSNPWWKTLMFSVHFANNTAKNLHSNVTDSRSLQYPRFQNCKLIQDYAQSQLQNQAIVSENKTWSKFMLWPELVNGSLAVRLPPGSRCQSCFAELSGEVAVSPHEFNYDTLPNLFPDVGDNGASMASCSIATNPNCVKDCAFKNAFSLMHKDEDQWKAFLNEVKLFFTECRKCDFCYKDSLSSHLCSACLAVQYCSTVCQEEDLGFHMTVCSTWAKDESRKILDKKKQKAHWKSPWTAVHVPKIDRRSTLYAPCLD